jgi:four helix bundle protein
MKLFRILPQRADALVIGKQLLRSGTSVAANYRAVCRARSHNEFYSKLCVTLEEADETLLWLELLSESGLVDPASIRDLKAQANELVAIFAAARKTARSSEPKSPNQQISKSVNGN